MGHIIPGIPDGEIEHFRPGFKTPSAIRATPYAWPDPKAIPPRGWLYGRHLIRGFVSTTIASGGIGKSSLVIVDALAMASGLELIGSKPARKLNVWLFNGEDPLDEMHRRIAATAKHYDLGRDSCAGLYVDSGRDTSMMIAQQLREGATIMWPVVEEIEAAIKERGIDVLIIDPFVSCHTVSENDNGAIDRVVKTWAKIADRTGCAIDLVHHSRKTGGEEVTVEHARGAVALIAAARSARVLNPMTPDDAAKAGIDGNPRLYFSVANGKSNLAPPPDGKAWFHLESVELGNGSALAPGDSVGVVTCWTWPDPLAGLSVEDLIKAQKAVALTQCREDPRSPAWAGHVIGQALGIDTGTTEGKNKVKAMLAVWVRTGMFKRVQGFDNKSNPRTFLEVAEWADE